MARHDDPKIVDIFWKQIIANGIFINTYQFINSTLIMKILIRNGKSISARHETK